MWERAGGSIRFYIPIGEQMEEEFKKATNEDPDKVKLAQGGNVLNQAWIFSINAFRSKAFIAVGNDLSFPYVADDDQRRKGFYVDGDYSSNIKNKRDEAKKNLAYMGFRIEPGLVNPKPILRYNLVSTSLQMMSYKVWMEAQMGMMIEKGLHYYNCSDQGILGVTAKSLDPKDMPDPDNWTILDEHPEMGKRWHTWRLADAARIFILARERCRNREGEIVTAASAATWRPKTAIAGLAVKN